MQVVNWSTWLSALVSCKDRVPAEFRSMLPNDFEDEEPVQFNLLKATGDLLMLPKEILLDSEIRKEVIPSTHSWVSVFGVLYPHQDPQVAVENVDPPNLC